MRSGHLIWAKIRQTSEVIDIHRLFNEYWASNEREFLVSSQSWSPPSPLIADNEVQGSLLLESVIVL
jgi:hypothetical protein